MDDDRGPDLDGRSALGVELAILRMGQSLGRAARPGAEPGWWVLALGEPLDDDDFGRRERAREKLRLALAGAGIKLPEYTWVWDESGRAQVVLASLDEQGKAQELAERVREAGIPVRVAREFE